MRFRRWRAPSQPRTWGSLVVSLFSCLFSIFLLVLCCLLLSTPSISNLNKIINHLPSWERKTPIGEANI
jgi:hypothetical protein